MGEFPVWEDIDRIMTLRRYPSLGAALGVSMKKLAWIALVAAVSLPVFGQATRDRNLDATRKHGATTTVLPGPMSGGQNGQKDVNSQLDKLERQTANTVIQPAAKTPNVQPYKLPPETHAPTGSSYEQTMPVRAPVKNAPNGRGMSRSSPGKKSSLYGR